MAEGSIPALSPDEDRKAKKRAHNHEYWTRHHARLVTKRRGYLRTYHEKNRDRILSQQRIQQKQKRDENLPKARTEEQLRHKKSRVNAPEKYLARAQRHRARKANAPINDFTAAEWRALCRATGYRCAYCDKKFPFKELEQDHVTPLSKGGSHTLPNIVPACKSCNCRKRDKDVPSPVQPFLLLEI